MKKILLLITSFLFTVSLSAQTFQGKAIYLSKTKVNFDFGERKIPEEHKQRMQKRMDEAMQKNFVLNFGKTTSLYEVEVTLGAQEGNGSGKGRGAMFASVFGGPATGKSYVNIADKESKRAVEFFGKNFLVEDSLRTYNWKLEKDIKRIGKYTCFKATTLVEKSKNSFSKDMDSLNTHSLVTVWYTPEIPVSLGPGKYWGLPGLILSVQSETNQVVCTEIVLNVIEKVEIKAPKSGKKISEEEFQEIVIKKTKEMKDRFQKGNGGRGGKKMR